MHRLWPALLALALISCSGEDRPPGTIEGPRRAPALVEGRDAAQDRAATALVGPESSAPKRILFGDLHVHTTYSVDAFFLSLPVANGEGAHPPADACDFARHCAALDFFALTDHAEALTPEHWAGSKESLRQCQARAGDDPQADVVAFAGWEWTQVGTTPEDHYGHKNVIFRDLAEDRLPRRPIGGQPEDGPGLFRGLDQARRLQIVDPLHQRQYADFLWLADRMGRLPDCPKGVDTRELPDDCYENSYTPDGLFQRLDQWGFERVVIPHGTTWGFYTPPGTSIDKQLTRRQHDPDTQTLVEVMSGHGNSEEFRSFDDVSFDADGVEQCPAPTADYTPCCWRAGEIMRERCGDLSAAECDARVEQAKQAALAAGIAPHRVFPDTTAEDWLDCGQCRDCFKPALNYRPKESVQYALSRSNFDERDAETGEPLRFRWGFIASSDNHTARAGTGYKQLDRKAMTDMTGARSKLFWRLQRWQVNPSGVDPRQPQSVDGLAEGILGIDGERVTSFLYPGGLAAVHAAGRSREAIWDALQRREVYGTSGPRILLWFDLRNGADGPVPMGGEARLAGTPRFEVRAVGSFRQKPGCPDDALQGLGAERMERLCRSECYNPGDERHPIVAIEVVRIRPQIRADEPTTALVEDPWRTFPCASDPGGCVVRFADEEFADSGRSALYYVRALQEETPAINGANLRPRFDADGRVVETTPCHADWRSDPTSDCLAPVQERAWSSPIYLDPAD